MKKKINSKAGRKQRFGKKSPLNVAETTTEASAGTAINLFCQNRQEEVF